MTGNGDSLICAIFPHTQAQINYADQAVPFPSPLAIGVAAEFASVGGQAGFALGTGIGFFSCASGGGGTAGGSNTPKKVTFGHGDRHLEGSGLNQAKVERAITEDVQATASNASSTGGFWGKVVVDGQTITYRAMTLADGSINVGTYTLPRP
jgi:hypothetical protein